MSSRSMQFSHHSSNEGTEVMIKLLADVSTYVLPTNLTVTFTNLETELIALTILRMAYRSTTVHTIIYRQCHL